MKAHLSIDQIVDFQHELCSEKDAARFAAHLEQCADCRKLAKTVEATLGQLNTIKESPEASETLITDTLRTVRNLDSTNRITFPRYAWIPALAAAALLLIIVTFTPISQRSSVQLAKSEKSAEVQTLVMDLNVPQEAVLAETEDADTTTLGMEFAMMEDADAVKLESTAAYDNTSDIIDESEPSSFGVELAGNESLNQLARAQGLTPVREGMGEDSDSPSLSGSVSVPVSTETEQRMGESPPSPEATAWSSLRSEENGRMGEMKDDSLADMEFLEKTQELPEGNTELAVLAMVAPSRDKEVRRERKEVAERESGGGLFFGSLAKKKAPAMDAVAPSMSFAQAPAAEAPRRQEKSSPAPTPIVPAETRITIDDRSENAWQLGPYHSVRVTREAVPVAGEIKDARFEWSWRVSALNTSDVPARVLITRDFQSTNWNISVSDEADLFIRDSHSAEIRLDVPPQSERSFIYSIGTPVSADSQ